MNKYEVYGIKTPGSRPTLIATYTYDPRQSGSGRTAEHGAVTHARSAIAARDAGSEARMFYRVIVAYNGRTVREWHPGNA